MLYRNGQSDCRSASLCWMLMRPGKTRLPIDWLSPVPEAHAGKECASDRIIVPVLVRQDEDNLDSLLETLNLLDALRDNELLDREIARHAAVFAPSVSGQKAALEMAQPSDRPPHHVATMMVDLMDPEEAQVEISAWTRRTLMALPVHRPSVDLK